MVSSSAIASAGTTTAPAPEQQSKASFAGGDFETFLKMLTTQIKHQDPLNPMEGSDFAVQLATFSGVEQQVQTNDMLQQMLGNMGAQSLSSYTGWIGKQVRTTGQVHFGQEPLTMNLSPDPTADKVLLVTRDGYGRRITVEDVGTGDGLVDWYGMDADGNRLPPGLYSFELESYRGDTLIETNKVASYSTVHEVRRNGGVISFVLTGGATAGPDEIDALAQGS